MMRKQSEPCTVCQQAKPPGTRARNKTCGATACVSTLLSQHGQIGAATTSAKWKAIRGAGSPLDRLSAAWSPGRARIAPPPSKHRTVLQPQIASYLATLAAANPT